MPTTSVSPPANLDAAWTVIGPTSDFGAGSLTTSKHGKTQLVIVRREDGEFSALDNRCPHEGYPLAQGDLKGCTLTCQWHNWKFDVRDGRSTLGGEGVRQFPVRIRDAHLEVDLAEPPADVVIPGLLKSLREGIFKHQNGRALRDTVRLLDIGYSPVNLLVDIVRDDALRAEYGSTHVPAVAADCARTLDRYVDAEAVYPLAPVIDLCGEENRRLRQRNRPTPIDVGGRSADDIGRELRDAVEREDAAMAEALLLGAFDAGIDRREIEGRLYAVVSDHFLDFGHPLIYLVKIQELIARLDENADGEDDDARHRDAIRDIMGGLLYGIVLGTREDTLPYMRGYTKRLRDVEGEFDAVWNRVRPSTSWTGSAAPSMSSRLAEDITAPDILAVRDAVLDAPTSHEAFDVTWNALLAGHSARAVAQALLAAGAHRLLRFDTAIESDLDLAETWVWVTHRFTFASAVRNAVERFDSPDALRLLFQAVAFIHSGRKMDLAQDDRPATALDDVSVTTSATSTTTPSTMNDIFHAIREKNADAALAATRSWLPNAEGTDVVAFRQAVEDITLRDPAVRPIIVAHIIKTSFAAFEEYDALVGHPDRHVPLLAMVRMLATRVAERRVYPSAYTSVRWVVDGVVPRKLTQ